MDVINVPDRPRASARMSAQSLCIQIQQQTGVETVLHYTCRDRNVFSIQSDLLGASSIGLKNILCITGDPPKLGDYPDATAVFDVDAIGLVNIVRSLNHGLDIGGNAGWWLDGISHCAWAPIRDCRTLIRRSAALPTKRRPGRNTRLPSRYSISSSGDFLRRIEGFRIPIDRGNLAADQRSERRVYEE